MFVFNKPAHCGGSLRKFAQLAVTLAAFLAAQACLSQQTHLWTQSRMDEFEKGVPQGVSITSDGRLKEGPGLTEILTTQSSYVWSIAEASNGTIFLGTASPATVVRVGHDGKPFILFESKDVSVQALKLGPDGALYAATLPSGKIYRIDADAATKQDESSAKVVFDLGANLGANLSGDSADKSSASNSSAKASEKSEIKNTEAKKEDEGSSSKSHYIWDLEFDKQGKLYIATGGPGAVYRIDPARPEPGPAPSPAPFFKTDEQHIRCLAWDAKGNLIAGTDGSGLVYRINPQGKGYVLFEAPRREITSIAVGRSGTIYAASVGDKSHNPLPPLPVQGVATVTITVLQPGSLQAANTSTSLPDGSEIYAITSPDDPKPQAPRKLWAGKDDVVYALAAATDGLLALTGNRGRVLSINDDGSYADVAHLEAQHGLSLEASSSEPNGFLIGTGNTGKLIRLGAIDKHEYASDVFDAGALARFGHIEFEPGSKDFDIYTRTGNVEQPVRGRNEWGWADWQPMKDGAVASPPGRYMEWKAVLKHGGVLGGVGVNYLPVNSAPVVDELVVAPGARLNPQTQAQNTSVPATVNINFPSTAQNGISFDAGNNGPLQALRDRTGVTVRWAAHDDNGDDLTYAVYLRGDGETVWRLLKDQITDKAYSFDATQVPDGGYTVKVVASDAPSNTPGDALTSEKISDRFEVDTTPPVVTNLKSIGASAPEFSFDAEDAFSAIAHAEYSLDAGPWQFVEPVGKLSDSQREHYDFKLPAGDLHGKPGEHLITVRVYDRHDNIGVAKTVFTAPAP